MYHVEDLVGDPEKLSALRSAVERPGAAGLMRSAKIKLTPRCNLQCRMCGIWRYKSHPELGTSRLLKIIEELKKLGCRKIHFSGGEPLLRDDLFDLLERCSSLKIRANLTTNGTLVSKEVAKLLIKSGARSVSVSLDGTRKTHDFMRGLSGAFKAAVAAIERLVDARDSYSRQKRARIRINTVMGRDNWREMPQIIKLAGQLGVDEIHPMPVDTKSNSKRPTKSEMADYNLCMAPEIKTIRETYGFSTDPGYVYPYGSTKRDLQYCRRGEYARGFYEKSTCYVPWLHAFIAWDGKVYPCCMTRGRVPELGDVSGSSIRDVFAGQAYAALRKNILEKRYTFCHKCDNFLQENEILKEIMNVE